MPAYLCGSSSFHALLLTRACRHQLVAWWLLLLLGRILTPETAVLSLHAHKHTTVEPARVVAGQGSAKALLTSQHQHCAVEHFYDVPLQRVATLRIAAPWRAPAYRCYRPLAAVHRVSYTGCRPALRGPPVG